MARLNKIPMSNVPAATLDRRQAVPALLERHADFLIVAGLAGTAQELSALTHESPGVFGLGGAMGASLSMGLGLALAQPKRRVLIVTGDGELLMNVGALATSGVPVNTPLPRMNVSSLRSGVVTLTSAGVPATISKTGAVVPSQNCQRPPCGAAPSALATTYFD